MTLPEEKTMGEPIGMIRVETQDLQQGCIRCLLMASLLQQSMGQEDAQRNGRGKHSIFAKFEFPL